MQENILDEGKFAQNKPLIYNSPSVNIIKPFFGRPYFIPQRV